MEFVRGLAAFGVMLYHFLLGFLPPVDAPEVAERLGLLAERPILIAFVNGPFMVAVFFVLSSFVLTVKLVHEPNVRAGIIAIIKRFPRLLPLTVVGSLFPAVLLAAGLMANQQAAELTQSSWLGWSGGVKDSENWPTPSVIGALKDSIMLFERGLSQYNSALWTMKYELFGSVFAIGTALLIGAQRRPVTDAVVVLLLGLVVLKVHPLCSICVGTVYLTKYILEAFEGLNPKACVGLIVLGLLLGSTYRILPPELLRDDWLERQAFRLDWMIHGAGAMLLFLGVRSLGGVPFQNHRASQTLGRLSFSIYVLHVPIQGSLASAVVLALGYDAVGVVAAFLISTLVLFLLAFPVANLDEWWVRRLNAFARRFTRRGVLPPTAARDPAP